MSDQSGQRTPPYDTGAERALVGIALLYGADAIADHIDDVTPGDFYNDGLKRIWAAIADLWHAGETTTPDVVVSHLRAEPEQAALVAELHTHAPGRGGAGRHARTIATLARLRRLIAVGEQLRDLGYEPTDDIDQVLDQAEQAVYAVADTGRRAATLVRLGDVHGEWLDQLEARRNGAPTGIPTGWADLDDLLGGLRPGQLVVIAGRPAMGKSAVGVQLALNTAQDAVPSLVATLEMSRAELEDRYAAVLARIPLTSIRDGRLSGRDWDRLGEHALPVLTRIPLHVLDDAGATITAIRGAARRTPDLGVLIVDYLQLIVTHGRVENRQVEVSEVSRNLKRIARDLGVPVVALCQLNRDLEKRADKRPQLSDLRESGAIENDADVVIGLYRDEVYNPGSPDRGTVELIVLKQRSGPTGTVRLAYDLRTGRISNMARLTEGARA